MQRFKLADFSSLLVALIWGINISVVKDALCFFDPLIFNALRLAGAAVIMCLCAYILEGWVPISRRDLLRFVTFGVLGNTVYQLLFIFGMQHTKAGNAALLVAGSTIFTAVFSRMLGHEKHGGRLWLGILTSLAGVLVILAESAGLGFSAATVKGDLMVLGATAVWGIYTVYARGAMSQYPTVFFSAVTFAVGAAVFLLIALVPLLKQDLSTVPARGFLDLGFSAFFGLTVGYLLFFYGVHRLGSTRASIYTNLTPFFGVLFAWFLLDEKVTPSQVVGGGLILFGIFQTRRPSHRDLTTGQSESSSDLARRWRFRRSH